MGTHLGNAAKKYEEAEKKLVRFDDKLSVTSEIASPELGTEDQQGLPVSDGEDE